MQNDFFVLPIRTNPKPEGDIYSALEASKRSAKKPKMAELLAIGASQSSLLLLERRPSSFLSTNPPLVLSPHQFSGSGLRRLRISLTRQGSTSGSIVAFSSGGGGGSGGDGSGGGNGGSEGEGEEEKNKKMGMSMSQKLTLGYAALVGGKISLFLAFCAYVY